MVEDNNFIIYNELENKVSNLFWSKDEAQVVADFINGQNVAASIHSSERKTYWRDIKEKTDFEDNEGVALLGVAKALDSRLFVIPQSFQNEEQYTEYEDYKENYDWMTQKRAQTVIAITINSLRKSGIWGENEHRIALPRSGSRREGKSNFSEVELIGEDIKQKGFLGASDGGPGIIPTIYVPKYDEMKNKSDARIRGSLSHEINHVVRSLVNQNMWKESEHAAKRQKVRFTKIEKTDNIDQRREKHEKRRNIGGFYVGSNMQGSEATGELFALLTKYKSEVGKDPTIKDIFPYLYGTFKKDIAARDKKPETRLRYFASHVALLDHINQLITLGHDNIEVKDLLALGLCGYVSLEKTPALLKLGVINHEKFNAVREVVTEIEDWLTEK